MHSIKTYLIQLVSKLLPNGFMLFILKNNSVTVYLLPHNIFVLFQPMCILLYGLNDEIESNVVSKLSEHFHIPQLWLKTIVQEYIYEMVRGMVPRLWIFRFLLLQLCWLNQQKLLCSIIQLLNHIFSQKGCKVKLCLSILFFILFNLNYRIRVVKYDNIVFRKRK